MLAYNLKNNTEQGAESMIKQAQEHYEEPVGPAWLQHK